MPFVEPVVASNPRKDFSCAVFKDDGRRIVDSGIFRFGKLCVHAEFRKFLYVEVHAKVAPRRKGRNFLFCFFDKMRKSERPVVGFSAETFCCLDEFFFGKAEDKGGFFFFGFRVLKANFFAEAKKKKKADK